MFVDLHQTPRELPIVFGGGVELISLEPALLNSLFLLFILIPFNGALLMIVIFIVIVMMIFILTAPSDQLNIFRFVPCVVQPEILPQLLIFILILLEVLHLAVLPPLPLLAPKSRLQFNWRVRMLEWNQSEFALRWLFDPHIPER